MKTKVYVYTRSADKENYPMGLASAVHFSWENEDGKREPLNRNYGILFAKGEITEKNTIKPYGIKNPKIIMMDNDEIGICAERILENGDADTTSEGKVILWKTKDIINFSEETLVDKDCINEYNPSDVLEIEEKIVEEAKKYWNPIVYTGVSVPEKITLHCKDELDSVNAKICYSDGSFRQKKIYWNTKEVCFEKAGTYEITGEIRQQKFTFPLVKGYGDPVIFPWEGKWYYISTNDNLDDIGIYVREADNVKDLFEEGVKEHLILPFDTERGFEQTFWAPEFHVIGGELYILFAVSGHVWGPQCHMMKKKKGKSIIEEDSWENPIRVLKKNGEPLATDAITLDMTFVRGKNSSYVIWSYREKIGTELDSGSMLYIASIDEREPWKLTSDPVLLTRPFYGWENLEGTINNEGPNAFIKDETIYVTYSGGAANGYTYVLGLLTAGEDADLLNLSSWTKSKVPVLSFYSVKGEYGPGHNAFFTNEEGELMISYHGETDIKSNLRCDGIRRVHFRQDGTPYFQMSNEEDINDISVKMRVTVS